MKKYPDKKLDESWIQEKITDDAVRWAESFGQFLQSNEKDTKPLTTNQIRKFFGELKRIQADPEKYHDEIPLLKAKLAYAVGRDIKNGRNKTKIKEFYEELERGIDSIRSNKKDDFIRFVKVVEAIVAYHKFFGAE